VLAGLRPKKQVMVVSKIGANFDASFLQILGMESEILWESDITPTHVRSNHLDILSYSYCGNKVQILVQMIRSKIRPSFFKNGHFSKSKKNKICAVKT
jgi:hypothetical protein